MKRTNFLAAGFPLRRRWFKSSPEERLEMLHRSIEPTLQRELRHRGIMADEGSFTAELLTWIEIA
jgi:hypothetical protein